VANSDPSVLNRYSVFSTSFISIEKEFNRARDLLLWIVAFYDGQKRPLWQLIYL
jgi:hypothetical protein